MSAAMKPPIGSRASTDRGTSSAPIEPPRVLVTLHYVHLSVVPLTLAEGNVLIAAWHRHHEEIQGHRFTIGIVDDGGACHGASIVGHPVARLGGSMRAVAEVTRLVTDGTPNACSMLYAASARAAEAMGYEQIQTYILDDEPGISLRASGWVYEGIRGGGSWARPNQPKRHTSGQSGHPVTAKGFWTRALNGPRPVLVTFPALDGPQEALGLVG